MKDIFTTEITKVTKGSDPFILNFVVFVRFVVLFTVFLITSLLRPVRFC